MKPPLITLVLLVVSSPLYAQDASSLAWDDAVRIFNSANLQKIQSRLAVESSSSKVSSSKGELLPQLSLTANYDKASDTNGYSETYGYGFSGSQPLFSPALSAQLRKSRADLRQAQYQDSLLDAQLLSSLRQAYADLLYEQDSASLSATIVLRRQENLDLIRLKYKSGLESNAALLETQSLLDSARFDHEHDLRELVLASRKLNQLLGRSLLTPVRVEKLFTIPAVPGDLSAFVPFIENHPQLEQDRAALDSALESVKETKSSFLPTAAATVNYNKTGYDWPNIANYWTYGVNLNWSIFSGGKTASDIRSAEADASRARTEINRIHEDIYLNAEDGFMVWREAGAYVAVAQSLLDASSARAWLLHNQYLSGQASYFEWRDAESQFINYQKQLLSAKNDMAKSYAAFLQALGKGEYPL